MCSPFRDAQGNTIPLEQVIGDGAVAVVVLQNGVAVKCPLRCPWSSDYDIQSSIRGIKREQDVYRRLQQPPDDTRSRGVVRCLEFCDETTHLAYMPNGDLKKYLATSRPPRELQRKWITEMAQALSYVHDRRVLVADIASRNFLLDADLSLKLCDFSEATLLPLDSDMDKADDNGYSTRIDVGLLGAVMFEIVTGERCKVDLYENNADTDGRAYWPERSALPATQGIPFGNIIEGCWDGRFRSTTSLLQALHLIHRPTPELHR